MRFTVLDNLPLKLVSLVLAVLPGVTPPASLPPCPGLRGQPCRTYAAAINGG